MRRGTLLKLGWGGKVKFEGRPVERGVRDADLKCILDEVRGTKAQDVKDVERDKVACPRAVACHSVEDLKLAKWPRMKGGAK